MSVVRALPRMVQAVLKHPANKDDRARALLRASRHFAVSRLLGRRTTSELGKHSRLYIDPSRPASSRVAIGNPPDPEEMRFLDRFIRPDDLFIDIGANVGIYSVYAADLGAEVIAVEPVHSEALRENLRLNDFEIPIIEAAVSNEIGEVEFLLDLDQQNAMASASAPGKTATVPTTTVDQILDGRSARLVKVDVEGFERFVIEGMSRSLSEGRIDAIQLEWNRASEGALGESRAPTYEALVNHGYVVALPDVEGRLRKWTSAYSDDEHIDVFALRSDLANEYIER